MAIGYTSDDVAALRAAVASGALRVKTGDREIIYRSQKELLEALRLALAEVSPNSSSTTPNLIKASFSKG